ncbi:MAG: hypothetical protein GX616_15565 [Planctomycetes bacterium]|nr:hypothetical protein [Planctomycetota bacterium]
MPSHPRNLRRAGAIKVLLIVLGAIFAGFILICAGCLTLAYFKTKPLVAEGIRNTAATPLDSTELSQAQRDRIQACIDRIMTAVDNNKINVTQLGVIGEEMKSGRYHSLSLIEVARSRIAGLLQHDAKRSEDASSVIDRLARGVQQGRIGRDRLARVLDIVTTSNEVGDRASKTELTEVEAEDFLEAALKEVDRAEIPNEPYQVDLAGELEKILNKVLGGAPSGSPAESDGPEAASKTPASSESHKSSGE